MAPTSETSSERLNRTADPQTVSPSPATSRLRGADGEMRDVQRIVRALRVGVGHIVVTARDVERAESLVESALDIADPYRVLRISATIDGLAAMAGDVLAFASDAGPAITRARDKASAPLGALIDEARAAARPVVVVVADADLSTAKRLESLRIQLDGTPGAIEVVRMILIGCPVLARILELPSARGLSSRVGMQVRFAEPKVRRADRRLRSPFLWRTK